MLDFSESTSEIASFGLPGSALTAWFDSGVLIRVDPDRVLHVGDQVVPGEYLWARR